MFLSDLSTPEKQAFLVLADAVIKADEALAPQEETMLSALRREMGLTEDAGLPSMSLDVAAAAFGRRATRVAAMLELIGLAWADGLIAPQEEDLLDRLRKDMDLDDSTYLALRDWVLRQMTLAGEAAVLMREEAA